MFGPALLSGGYYKDGTLSIWTVGGRKHLRYTIPEDFKCPSKPRPLRLWASPGLNAGVID